MTEAVLGRTVRTARSPTSAHGVALLGVTRSLDAVTTLLGLALVPTLEEANPLARAIFAAIGPVAGLVVLSVAGIAAVTLVTELGVSLIETGEGPIDGTTIRYLGYGLPSVLSLVAAVHNARLLVTVIGG